MIRHNHSLVEMPFKNKCLYHSALLLIIIYNSTQEHLLSMELN